MSVIDQIISEARKSILRQMGVAEETIGFLSQMGIPFLQEWSCLCAAEGMTKETLERLCAEAGENKNEASETFIRERENHLRLRYENNRELKDQFKRLQGEIESMYKRASNVETALDETIRKTLHDKDELFGKLVEEKDQAIKDRDRQIRESKERIRSLEEKLDAQGKKEEMPEKKEMQTTILHEEKGDGNVIKRIDKDGHGMTGGYSVNRSHDAWIPAFYQTDSRKRISFPWRRHRSSEQFIRKFMENEDYSEEQKDFLIQCLEQGDSLEFIQEFASPKLSIEHMAWLRRILERRRHYGR